MPRLTPRLVRHILIPASYVTFLVGLIASSVIFYRSRPFDPKAAIISDLQSPDENPHGYGPCAAGIAIFGLLLVPRARPILIAVQTLALLLLIYLYLGPEVFSNDRLVTSLAFWEWMLCNQCGAGLWALARTVEEMA